MFDNYHYLFIYLFFTIHVTFICVLLFVCGVGTSRCYVGATITPCIILFFLFLFFKYVAQVVAILYVFLPCVIANVRHFVTVVCEQHYKSSLICICTAVIFIVVLGLKQ